MSRFYVVIALLATVLAGCDDGPSETIDVLEAGPDTVSDARVDTMDPDTEPADLVDVGPDIEDAVADVTELQDGDIHEVDVDPGVPCTVDTVLDDCPAGQGCVAEYCAACEVPEHCSPGMLCNGGMCQFCGESPDCIEQYGERFECRLGLCTNTACVDDTDCRLSNGMCDPNTHRCTPCETTYECTNSPIYGPGYQCLDGECSEGDCELSANCDPDKPICGQDYYCRSCQGDGECLEREAALEGFVCHTGTGQCLAGVCFPAGSACGSEGRQICTVELACEACQNDEECRTSMDRAEAVCVDGACELGCDAANDCPTGWVCAGDHRCGACSDNADCGAAYGSAFLCMSGVCTDAAECNAERACLYGEVCDPDTFVCRDCYSDDECPGAICDQSTLGGTGRCVIQECTFATADQHCDSGLCEAGACIPCSPSKPCGVLEVCIEEACVVGECTEETQDAVCPRKLCDENHWCTACHALDECGADRICDLVTSTCYDGECLTNGHCGQVSDTLTGELCADDDGDGTNECVPCTDDAECQTLGYGASSVCNGGVCENGCVSHGECAANLCVAGQCVDCDDNTDCRVGGREAVCIIPDGGVTGACVEGNCSKHTDCPRLLCENNWCTGCYHVEGCGGTEAEPRICDVSSNTCLNGNCLTTAHCGLISGTTEGHFCDVDKTCQPCSDDSDCSPLNGFPPNNICVVGMCEQGCNVHDDCASLLCKDGHCLTCDTDAECQAPNGLREAVCDTAQHVCIAGDCIDDTNCDGWVEPDDPCNVASCVQEPDGSRHCAAVPVADTTACSTGACLTGGICLNGLCIDQVNTCPNLPCVDRSCDSGTCEPDTGTIDAYSCFIDEVCWDVDALNPNNGCEYCAGNGDVSWSQFVNGTDCSDPTDPHRMCYTETCRGGVCEHHNDKVGDACDLAIGDCHAGTCGADGLCTDENTCLGNTPYCCEPDVCCECRFDGDCNDGNACTTDTCTGGACANAVVPDRTGCGGGLCCDGTCNPDCCDNTDCGCHSTAACRTYTTQIACQKHPVCSWRPGLPGCLGDIGCVGIFPQATCEATPGCIWNPGGGLGMCVVPITACTYGDQANCIANPLEQCEWTVCNGAGSCEVP